MNFGFSKSIVGPILLLCTEVLQVRLELPYIFLAGGVKVVGTGRFRGALKHLIEV